MWLETEPSTAIVDAKGTRESGVNPAICCCPGDQKKKKSNTYSARFGVGDDHSSREVFVKHKRESESEMAVEHDRYVAALEPALVERGTTFLEFVKDSAFERHMRLSEGCRMFNCIKLNYEKSTSLIARPQSLDVVFGRGNQVSRTPGNFLFRQCVGVNKGFYNKAHKEMKGNIARFLISHFRKVGTRFLEATQEDGGRYAEADYERVYEKFCQTLREKKFAVAGFVPEVRKNLTKSTILSQKRVKTGQGKVTKKRKKTHEEGHGGGDAKDKKSAKKRKLHQTKATTTKQNKGQRRKKSKATTTNPIKAATNSSPVKQMSTKSKKRTFLKEMLAEQSPPTVNQTTSQISPATPMINQILLSSWIQTPTTVTPPVDVVATVSLASKDASGTASLYQGPGIVSRIPRLLTQNRQNEEHGMIQAFRESVKDSASYARETIKRHRQLDMKSIPVDNRAENLLNILRPYKLQKSRPGAVLPMPLFHDDDYDEEKDTQFSLKLPTAGFIST